MSQFSKIFLEKYIPCSFLDYLRDLFSRLERGYIMVVEYEAWFYKVAGHATYFFTIEYERVHWFIRGLRLLLCISTYFLVGAFRSFLRFFIMLNLWKRCIIRPKGVAIKRCDTRLGSVGAIVAQGLEEIILRVGSLRIIQIGIKVSLIAYSGYASDYRWRPVWL